MADPVVTDTARTMLIAATSGLLAGGGIWKFFGDRLAAHQARDTARAQIAEDTAKYVLDALRLDNQGLRERIARLEAEVLRLGFLDLEVKRLAPFEIRCAELQRQLSIYELAQGEM